MLNEPPSFNLPFQAVFASADVGLCMADMQGSIVAVNRAMQQMLGYDEQEMQGRHIAVLVAPEESAAPGDGDEFPALFARLQVGELPLYKCMKRYRRRDGSSLHGKLTVSLVQQEGAPAYALCLLEDMTEQMGALAALEEAQARFNQLAEHLDVVFWIFDVKDFRAIYESPAFETAWGRTIASVTANPQYFFDSVVPEDRPHVIASFEKFLAGKPTCTEYRIQRPDGEIRYILDKGFPVFDKHGAVINIAGLAADVTDARLATDRIRRLNESLEQRVRERTKALQDALIDLEAGREFFYQITESMREGIVVYGSDGIIEYANPYVQELTGIPLEEIVGRPDGLAQLADDPETVVNQKQTRNQGLVGDYEITLRLPNGERKHVHIVSTPRMQKGNYAGGVAVISDLTQRRQAEENLRQTAERLAAANLEMGRATRMKDEFLANVSHELRTPLTGILGLSEALESGGYGALREEQQRPMALIGESGRHLLSLINDILDLTKSGANRLELTPEPVQVNDVCRASLRMVQDLAKARRQQVVYNIQMSGLCMMADGRRLKQILVNLLSNAVKFTPEGGCLGLDVQYDEERATVTFTVWDQGIGIPADRIDQIFQPFTQIESELSRSYAGTGLGLALVRQLAVLHGGSVSVESRLQQGSYFRVELPWRACSLLAQPAPFTTRTAWPVARPASNPLASTILMAEDDQTTRTVLQDFLERQGWRVFTATDGVEAVRAATALRPNLVLMDIQMPNLDGVGAIQQLRASPDPAVAQVPIIVLTAHAMNGAQARFLAAGADDFLSKPVRLIELRQRVAGHLARAQAAGC